MKKQAPYLALLLLAACNSHYQPILPHPETPLTWKETVTAEKSFAIKNRFWELFEDPLLNEIEQEAIAANLDLQVALCRIDQARALVSHAHAKRLPEVGLSAQATADETLINPRFYGTSHGLERVEQRQYNLLAAFNYEIDLWGKFKAKETSAYHREEAARWEYEFVYQTIVTDVAARYFTLRTLEEQIRFLTQAIQMRQDTVNLHQCRVEAGFDPEVDLSRAKLELALAQVEIQQAQKERSIQEHALATLLGKSASSWSLPSGCYRVVLPALPELLPSEVLLRRADVQQQLALLAAGRSDVDVALKEYFPSFSLTAALGLVSPALSDLIQWQARYWQYTFNALAPLYDGGSRKAQVKQAKAYFHTAFATYQQTVNRAFQDVEDALSTLHYTQLQYDAQLSALEAAQDTSYLAKDRYETGLISYLLVADSENTSLAVARRAIALRGEQILAWIRLMRALGIQRD